MDLMMMMEMMANFFSFYFFSLYISFLYFTFLLLP